MTKELPAPPDATSASEQDHQKRLRKALELTQSRPAVSHKFSSKARKASDAVSHLDPTAAFRDPAAWQYAHLATLGLGTELTQIAYGQSSYRPLSSAPSR